MIKDFNPVCDFDNVLTENDLPSTDTLSENDNGLHMIVGHKRNGNVYRFQWNNRNNTGSWSKSFYFDKGSVLDQLFSHEQKETERMYLELRNFIEDKNTSKEKSLSVINNLKESNISIKDLYKIHIMND